MQSVECPYAENISNLSITDASKELHYRTLKQVVVTDIGSSIVSVNQQTCTLHSISPSGDSSSRGDSSPLSTISSKYEPSISKPDQSVTVPHRPDHVTLLSVGDTSDTQIKHENS